ncbi:MAG: hypothetical protein JRJ47_12440 [Deltaproteobacteria bacterium]|nr:hypothetical protein [Deltaproteobacteria bacterium]
MATGGNLQPGAAVIGLARGTALGPALKAQERVEGSTDGTGPAATPGTTCTLVEMGVCTGMMSMAGQDAKAPIGIRSTQVKAPLPGIGALIPIPGCKETGLHGRWEVMLPAPQDKQDHTVAPEPVDAADLIPGQADLVQDPEDPIPGDPAEAGVLAAEGVLDKGGYESTGLTDSGHDYINLILISA